MARPRPKADYLEHAWHFYGALFRWGRGVSSGAFDCTWAQLIRRCGYAPGAKVQSSLERYAALLEELGLVRIAGVRDGAGRWQRLDVELLAVDGDPSPVDAGRVPPGHRGDEGRVWRRRRLTLGDRRLLEEACRGARAGRLPRRLAPRLYRLRNLGSPLGVGWASPPQHPRALRARTLEGRPADGSGKTRSSAAPGAHGGAFGTGAGFAVEPAAPDGRGTPPGSGEPETVRRTLIRAALEDPATLPAVAVAAQIDGADPVVVVEAAWRTIHGDRAANLSPERRLELDVALRRLDRYSRFGAGELGAGVRLAVERLLADLAEPGAGVFHHLGGLTAWLSSAARRWRRDAQIRTGKRPPYRPRIRPAPRRRGWAWPDD